MQPAAQRDGDHRTWEKQNGWGRASASLLGYGCMGFPTTPEREAMTGQPRAETLLNATRDAD